MPFCRTSQGNVFHQVLGDGPPLILLHADASSSAEFISVMPSLATRFQVIVVDYPGCGQSPRRAFSCDYYIENAKAVTDVARKVSKKPAWAIGTGGGAVVGLWMAILAPSLIQGVVADSFVEFLDSEDVHKDLVAHQKPTREMIDFWREMNGGDWQTVVSQLDGIFASMAEQQRSLFNWRLEEICCPVLVTGSRKDHLLSNLGRRMLESSTQLPAAKFILYPEGGHPSMWSQANCFWRDALAFIEANGTSD